MKPRGRRVRGRRRNPTRDLRARLAEAEATLEAIRSGEVDALVVAAPGGEQTRAIEGATHPYQVLLNAMGDGAALLTTDGTILFVNRRLGEIARAPLEDLHGSRFQQVVAPADRPGVEALLRSGRTAARECTMLHDGTGATPVWLALSTVPLGADPGVILMAIITDLTERKQAEATRLGLMQRLLSAEDDERRRIARELHDETGQALTALLVGLRAIEDQAISGTVLAVARRLRTVAAQTVDNVGRLSRGLHPAVLDDQGLAAAARRHVRDFSRAFDIAVDLRVERTASSRLSPLVRTTMYRILQESLTNVARHAHARAVGVVLKNEGTMLELVIRDDGVGFDANTAFRGATRLGLHGMRERVALLGGSVEIESRPGHGTTIRARIPAPPPPESSVRPPRSSPRENPAP